MKRPLLFGLIAAFAVLLGAGGFAFMKYREAASDYAAMRALEEETRSRYADAIDEIATIQDSLNAIVLGDSAAHLVSSDLAAEQRLYESRGDMALARISVIRAGIERAKRRIQELDESLQKSGVEAAGLQRMVASLRRTIAQKEEQIAELTGQVGNLRTQVSGLSRTVRQNEDSLYAQQQRLERRRLEISTVYYAIGTKRDLTDAGLVKATGGLLGIGRTLEPTGLTDSPHFTALDTDHVRVIRIPGKKAEVLSAQPPSSYEIHAVGDVLELYIVDVDAFRKVKHVLIMVS